MVTNIFNRDNYTLNLNITSIIGTEIYGKHYRFVCSSWHSFGAEGTLLHRIIQGSKLFASFLPSSQISKPCNRSCAPLSKWGKRRWRGLQAKFQGASPERGTHHLYPHAIDQPSPAGPPRCQVAEKYSLWCVKEEERNRILINLTVSVTGTVDLHKSITWTLNRRMRPTCVIAKNLEKYLVIMWLSSFSLFSQGSLWYYEVKGKKKSDKSLQLSKCNFQVNVQFYSSGGIVQLDISYSSSVILFIKKHLYSTPVIDKLVPYRLCNTVILAISSLYSLTFYWIYI